MKFKKPEIKTNRQGLEYFKSKELDFFPDKVEVTFSITGQKLTVTKEEYENGEFDDALAIMMYEAMNSNAAKFIKVVADTKKESPKKETTKKPAKPRTKKAETSKEVTTEAVE